MKLKLAAAIALLIISAPLLSQTAVYQSSLPTLNNNDRTDLRASAKGGLLTTLVDPSNGSLAEVLPGYADTNNPNTAGLWTNARGYVYDSAANSWQRQRGDVNGTVVAPALPGNFWSYAAAASGIVNTTTAVTIKAAAGASVRNYVCSISLSHDALGAATEFAIRDGAAGTVLFRSKMQTAASENNSVVTFSPCLKGTANTLVEVVTLTASVTGGVYVNASGFTGN